MVKEKTGDVVGLEAHLGSCDCTIVGNRKRDIDDGVV